MRFGAHVPSSTPASAAAERRAEVIQVFLSSPRQWRAPSPKPDGWIEEVAPLPLYVHAPYLVNLASASEDVRARSVTLLQATLTEADRVGADGVVVHAGQGGVGGSIDVALDLVVDGIVQLVATTPLLIENTATGVCSLGRDIDVWERLFARLHATDLRVPIGACLDTCHLWSGADWDDPDTAEVTSLTARFVAPADTGLVHVNDSHDPAGAGRDHHANLGAGCIPPEGLLAMLDTARRRGWADAVVETPGGAEEQAADIAWLVEHAA
jgi:deoxyribonuclease IV